MLPVARAPALSFRYCAQVLKQLTLVAELDAKAMVQRYIPIGWGNLIARERGGDWIEINELGWDCEVDVKSNRMHACDAETCVTEPSLGSAVRHPLPALQILDYIKPPARGRKTKHTYFLIIVPFVVIERCVDDSGCLGECECEGDSVKLVDHF